MQVSLITRVLPTWLRFFDFTVSLMFTTLSFLAGCIVEVDTDEPTTCTPAKGSFTLYAEPGTSEASLDATSDYTKTLVKNAMDKDRYESQFVVKAVYIGDRDLLTAPDPVVVQAAPPSDDGILKIALYCLAGACGVLLCLLCYVFILARKRKHRNLDEEMAMGNYTQTSMDRKPEVSFQSLRTQLRPPNQSMPMPMLPTRQLAPKSFRNNTLPDHASASDSEGSVEFQRNAPPRPQLQPPKQRRATMPNRQLAQRGFTNNILTDHELSLEYKESAEFQRNAQKIAKETIPVARGQRRVSAPDVPVQTIGETGEFFLKNEHIEEDATMFKGPDPLEEGVLEESDYSYEESSPLEYARGGVASNLVSTGVLSVPDDDTFSDESESEEELYEEPPVKTTKRSTKCQSIKDQPIPINSTRNLIETEEYKPRESSAKRNRKKRIEKVKVKFLESSENDGMAWSPEVSMSREERQKRMNKARSRRTIA